MTDSSVWTFDGSGRYRRTPRWVRRSVVCLDNALDYDCWLPFEQATIGFDPDVDGLRVTLLPPGRVPGSVGVVSGVVRWTNLPGDGLFDPSEFGAPDSWFPPSPVPSDRDLWPTELPFTAFGQFGPDELDLRVFDQDVYWVDRAGCPHLIDEMDALYVANVIAMLTRGAFVYHQATMLRERIQVLGDLLLGRPNVSSLMDELGIGSVRDVDASVWLESTPLMRRLRRKN